MLLSACSWFSSSDSTQSTSQQSSSSSTVTTSQNGSETSGGAEAGGSSKTGATGSSNALGSGSNDSQKSKGKAISQELANELLESAKNGKLNDCEFPIGTKLQEVISKWGDPQAGDVSVAIYRSKRCSFYTDYSETTVPVAPTPASNNEETSSPNEEGAESSAEDTAENADQEATEEQSEQNSQLETPIEEDVIDDLSKLNIVAIVSSDAKYRNINIDSVKQALGKPAKEQRRKLIYQAGSYTLEFSFKDKLVTSVVVAK
jgi:hypothetical protein